MASHHDPELLPFSAFRPDPCGRMRLYKKDSKPPNYDKLAEASEDAAKMMYDLGQDQLSFAKQQYEDLTPMFEEIVGQQMAISEQTAAQGQDYYEYQKSFRPVEQQMMADAMEGRPEEIAAYDAANQADAAKLTMDPTGLYNAHRDEIENQVSTAVADTQGAYTRAINQAIRQGLRYGSGMHGITAGVGNIGLSQAQMQAAAANNARDAGINDVRGRTAMGLQLRQSNMGAKNAQEAIDWAKQLDAAGLVKGLPGASAGAYGLAINAGNSAGQNAMAPGSQYMQGMAQGANTIASGQQMKIGGLSTIANNQTQWAMNDANQPDMFGTLAGATLGAFMPSDRRLKENVKLVGTDPETRLAIYEFNYKGGAKRFRGVMADEVALYDPQAVKYDSYGWASVDYNRLGIEFKEIAHG